VEAPDTIFAIPSYRLRDVPETVVRYDENFWLNGHAVASGTSREITANRDKQNVLCFAGLLGVTGIDCNQSVELPHERRRTA